jgi:UDPglucose 6-dehydrogenase
MREAPSRVVIAELLERGATVVAYDPVAMDEARRVFAGQRGVSYAGSPLEATDRADALAIVTEWKEFRSPDFDALRERLRQPVIFDGRNLYEPDDMRRLGFEYFPIGRGTGQGKGAA